MKTEGLSPGEAYISYLGFTYTLINYRANDYDANQ